ncbi:hypothetical protein QJQ45_020851 [Haematococcus lacustris]|nr:hypothetical protein QJQ45_020851 [Haematococcus lacustris]
MVQRILLPRVGSTMDSGPTGRKRVQHGSVGNALVPFYDDFSTLVHSASNSGPITTIAYGLERWKSELRSEARQRLGGFQPPLPISNGLLAGADLELLARVATTNNRLVSGFGNSMKRSASENSLEQLGGVLQNRRFARKPWVWDESDTDAAPSPQQPSTLSSGPQQQLSLVPLIPFGRGLPRVATAPLLQELGDTFNNNALRNFEAVRLALQNAQLSIQQTAVNCQQNLQTLSNLFQQSMPSSGSPLQTALSSSKAMVTWSIANSGDPVGGALVPWQVFPRYMRARELDAQQGALTLTSGVAQADSEEHSSSKGGGGVMDWVTPLENYVAQLDAKRLRKRAGGSIRDPGRQVAIVTTASLPWLTGTAVNPLLRAAYLATDVQRKVTLVLPWLSLADQQRVFPNNLQFDTPEQQEEYVRDWARKRTGLDCNFKVTFYPSRYAAEKGSILPVGDITSVIPDHEADVAVLEEPEHLNWYHHGARWTDKFNHVVGVMHTNYLDYARREDNGNMKEAVLRQVGFWRLHINAWVCRIHCHKVIKLSDAVQPLPREDTMFVHGVSPAFLKVGQAKAAAAAAAAVPAPATPTAPPAPLQPAQQQQQALSPQAQQQGEGSSMSVFGKGVYFLGKVLWAKGYTELLDRLNEHTARTGEHVAVDVYGSGPDLKAVEEEAARRRLDLHFHGAKDHADSQLQDYKVFINPSLSDVVATTTAEALAMGKWVVCADHPSNAFFKRYNNCLIYRNSEEFSRCLHQALQEDPRPLSPEELHSLTWEAATERFLDVADSLPRSNALETGLDSLLHAAHNTLVGVEFFRVAMGAGSHTRDAPARITDYVPCENDVGGFFDDSARVKKSWEGKAKPAGRRGAVGSKGVLPQVPEKQAVA